MGRLFILIMLALAAVWLVKRALGKPPGEAPRAADAGQGDLVSCAQCGVHLPRAEARLAGDRIYCSDEHARLGPRQG